MEELIKYLDSIEVFDYLVSKRMFEQSIGVHMIKCIDLSEEEFIDTVFKEALNLMGTSSIKVLKEHEGVIKSIISDIYNKVKSSKKSIHDKVLFTDSVSKYMIRAGNIVQARRVQIYHRPKRTSKVDIDPGMASQEEIADILSDLSILYRKMGGSGLKFSVEGVKIKNDAALC